MDAPYEQSRTATALRLIDAALRARPWRARLRLRRHGELAMTAQKPHANAIHGRTVEEEAHPTPTCG